MKKTINLMQPVISGSVVRELIEIIPDLKDSFTQRKEYDEYYFEEKEIDISLDLLQKLGDNSFMIHLNTETAFILW